MYPQKSKVLDFSFRSDLFPLSDAVDRVHEAMSRLGMADCHSVPVVLRELLRNAVVHGNSRDSRKEVKVALWIWTWVMGPEKIEIQVTDQGEGFDHSKLHLELPEKVPENLPKRGLILAKSLSETLTFHGRGNQVVATIATPEKKFHSWRGTHAIR